MKSTVKIISTLSILAIMVLSMCSYWFGLDIFSVASGFSYLNSVLHVTGVISTILIIFVGGLFMMLV